MFQPSPFTVGQTTLAGTMEVEAPVVAYWDLETMKADWGLYRESRKTFGYLDKGRGGPDGPALIATCAVKYSDEDVVHSRALSRNNLIYQSDRDLVKWIHGALSRADIIVAYNQKGFDLKQLQTRGADYGIEWIGHKPQRDPMAYVKANLDLHSNAMGDVAERFGAPTQKGRPPFGWADALRRKTSTGKREPDMSVMPGVLEYNEGDVIVLEWLDQHFLSTFPDYGGRQ